LTRRSMKIPDVLPILIVVVMIIGISIFLSIGYGSSFGITAEVGSNLVLILPSIFFFIMGSLIVAATSGLFVIMGFGGIGIGLALLLSQLNIIGILQAQDLGYWSVTEAQTVIIILSLMVGGIVALATRRS